jgi:hypothetical protein
MEIQHSRYFATKLGKILVSEFMHALVQHLKQLFKNKPYDLQINTNSCYLLAQ